MMCCSDKTAEQASGQGGQGPRSVSDIFYDIDMSPDIPIIPVEIPDAYVDPCLNISSSSEYFCDCQPQCCQIQMWYCPPNGLNVNGSEVVMNICDDNFEVCDRATNLNCPPNEILSRSPCRSIQDCPPNLENDLTITVQCEIEGEQGTQEILCTKGNIQYGECVICEPGEERCNYEDDDCDGLVDEDQTNACGMCGQVPADVCDGIDNDCDGSIDEELVRECVTACERGVETCMDGAYRSCSAIQPSEEICDGADNDCDGNVDEQLECLCTIQDVGNLQPCSEPPLLCGQGFKTCECTDPTCTEFRMTQCAAICEYLPIDIPGQCDPLVGLTVQQEECNAFDEDCDQEIDENLTQPCYTGDPDTLFVGVCSPGEAYCNLGVWGNDLNEEFRPGLCADEVLPQREICDGADNDCDGEVDYGDEIRNTDILFIVDWSGSMDEEIAAVRIALNQFAQQFAAEEALQWGLIIGPKESPGGFGNPELLIKVADISPFDEFLQSFAALGNEGMDTGNEMLKDAVYLAIQNITGAANIDVDEVRWKIDTGSQPEKENFEIQWREDSDRIIILFSDEGPQTFWMPPTTPDLLLPALRAAISLKLYGFVDQGWEGNRWEDYILAGGGQRFELTANANDMYNDLMSIIDQACLPNGNEANNSGEETTPAASYEDYSSAVQTYEPIYSIESPSIDLPTFADVYQSLTLSKYYDFKIMYCHDVH